MNKFLGVFIIILIFLLIIVACILLTNKDTNKDNFEASSKTVCQTLNDAFSTCKPDTCYNISKDCINNNCSCKNTPVKDDNEQCNILNYNINNCHLSGFNKECVPLVNEFNNKKCVSNPLLVDKCISLQYQLKSVPSNDIINECMNNNCSCGNTTLTDPLASTPIPSGLTRIISVPPYTCDQMSLYDKSCKFRNDTSPECIRISNNYFESCIKNNITPPSGFQETCNNGVIEQEKCVCFYQQFYNNDTSPTKENVNLYTNQYCENPINIRIPDNAAYGYSNFLGGIDNQGNNYYNNVNNDCTNIDEYEDMNYLKICFVNNSSFSLNGKLTNYQSINNIKFNNDLGYISNLSDCNRCLIIGQAMGPMRDAMDQPHGEDDADIYYFAADNAYGIDMEFDLITYILKRKYYSYPDMLNERDYVMCKQHIRVKRRGWNKYGPKSSIYSLNSTPFDMVKPTIEGIDNYFIYPGVAPSIIDVMLSNHVDRAPRIWLGEPILTCTNYKCVL